MMHVTCRRAIQRNLGTSLEELSPSLFARLAGFELGVV